jgi:predicted amidohydrolase YtcJ
MANADEIRALVDLRREGPLPVRVRMQLPFALLQHASATGFRTGFGDEWLRIGAVKLFSDGSLGARTAALIEPYSDDSSTSGELIYSPEELARRVEAVYAAGFQVCIHAIGDRAMQVTLDAIEHAAATHPNPFPPRIEHASVVNTEIVERMRALGVGAAVQPQFARSDYWSPERLGTDRAKGCYAFRTLWKAGVVLAGSTDCPVEKLDALAAIGQMVHRPEWSPQEALPLDAVLRIVSEGSYRIDGDVAGSGRLERGRSPDFLVLEQDPREVPPPEIEGTRPTMTVVGGVPSYQAGRSKRSIM